MSVRNFEPVDGKPIELVVDQAGTKVTLNKGDRVVTNPVCRPLRILQEKNQLTGGLTRPHPEILLHSPTRTISLLALFNPYTMICANCSFLEERVLFSIGRPTHILTLDSDRVTALVEPLLVFASSK